MRKRKLLLSDSDKREARLAQKAEIGSQFMRHKDRVPGLLIPNMP